MRNYLKPPLGYLVRVADAPGRDRASVTEAEAAGRFLSYERIGKVASADTMAARDCARIISNFGMCESGPEVIFGLTPQELGDEALNGKGLMAVLSYLAQPKMGLPSVVIVYPETMRAVCEHFQPGQLWGDPRQIVGPGGILGVYQDGTTIEIETRLGSMTEVRCASAL